jgi:cobalamin biosynthesis protein CbiG
VDEMATHISALISDVLQGQLVIETRTRIPGRVSFLKIFKKHAVATSDCRLAIAIPSMKIQSQECESKTKL